MRNRTARVPSSSSTRAIVEKNKETQTCLRIGLQLEQKSRYRLDKTYLQYRLYSFCAPLLIGRNAPKGLSDTPNKDTFSTQINVAVLNLGNLSQGLLDKAVPGAKKKKQVEQSEGFAPFLASPATFAGLLILMQEASTLLGGQLRDIMDKML